MEDNKVTVEQVKEVLAVEIDQLAQAMADAMNGARDGHIIADSEEPVRDAHAVFRQLAFQKALSLLQAKQEAFSPSVQRVKEQGPADRHAPNRQRPRRRT